MISTNKVNIVQPAAQVLIQRSLLKMKSTHSSYMRLAHQADMQLTTGEPTTSEKEEYHHSEKWIQSS
jgi:hypothetical protein